MRLLDAVLFSAVLLSLTGCQGGNAALPDSLGISTKQMPEYLVGVWEGRCEDYFSGKVSADGKRWEVKWLNYTWLEGADPPDREIIEANPEQLIFTKMAK